MFNDEYEKAEGASLRLLCPKGSVKHMGDKFSIHPKVKLKVFIVDHIEESESECIYDDRLG